MKMCRALGQQGNMRINEGVIHTCQNTTVDGGKVADPQGHLVTAGGFEMAQPL